MNITQITGILASVLTAASLIPQLVKLVKEKQPDHVSMGMLAILLAGLVFWVWYGILKKDWILISSNAVSLLLNVIIIAISIHFKKKEL